MKIVLNENKLEKIMLRYIQDIMKVDLEPTVDGDNNLYYRDSNGDIFIKVDIFLIHLYMLYICLSLYNI
jgi:hypothetical protein